MTELKYRVVELTYRCGCGEEYIRYKMYEDEIGEECPILSECCNGRKALPIRLELQENPDWRLVSSVYGL